MIRLPFRWAGGKSRILNDISALLPPDLDEDIRRYVEPFVGGGSVLMHMLSNHSIEDVVASDINKDLINFYVSLKENPIHLARKYDIIRNNFLNSRNKEIFYYNYRDIFNKNVCGGDASRLTTENAALMLFLNKTSYNGIYRVNREGYYNVPYGKREKIPDFSPDNFNELSHILKNTKFICADFEKSITNMEINAETFIYFDPPYVTGHQKNGFIGYNEFLFPWESQKAISQKAMEFTKKGAKCMISNADSKYIRDLYVDKIFKINTLKRKCCIGGPKESRGDYFELIITNY